MTTNEATEFLNWYNEERSKYLYLSRFKTSKPFNIDYPNAGKTKTKALITLGRHEFQQSYDTLLRIYPNLTLKRYNKQRAKLGIKSSQLLLF